MLNVIEICILAAVCTPSDGLSTNEALRKHASELSDRSYVVFNELRENPIKWIDSISEEQIIEALSPVPFVMHARPGEYFVYQLGVWALRNDIQDVRVEFSDLKAKNGEEVLSTSMGCFNTGGTDFRGNPFTKQINIPARQVQSLWVGIDLGHVGKGDFTGSVSIIANGETQTVPVRLIVDGEVAVNHGYDEGKKLSRLNWLNSTLGTDEEVTRGFLPVGVEGNTISILGRTLSIAASGLPAQISSYFSPSNQSLLETSESIVGKPFRFVVEKEGGEIIRLSPGELTITKQTPSTAVWQVVNSSDECELLCTGQMEFDGFVDYRLQLTARVPLKIRDIRLEVPVVKEKAEYMMGLGHEGGVCEPSWEWNWDVSKNQDMLWLGAVNGGLQIKLKAENYVGPLCDVFYDFGRLNLPPSWGNGNLGGVRVRPAGDDVLINAFSGNREMSAGDVLNYDFELLITPFKLIDRQIKFNDRFFQDLTNCPELLDPGYNSTSAMLKLVNAKQMGANIVNIHHDVDMCPFINYPCMDENIPDLKELTACAHQQGLRVGLYYSTRFMTVHQPEFWAFVSLGDEIVSPGPRYTTESRDKFPKEPEEWHIKNLKGRQYLPANSENMEEGRFKGVSDHSVVTGHGSRLDNFYIGYLDWMVQNLGIDGIYLDETTLDRITLRRARKIIDKYVPKGRMDLHSFNHYYRSWGQTNCLNFYMDRLPYLDFTWIGEARDYDRMPDYWLIEVSGIPFGVPGQMLKGGGNPWRGMVFGITKRAGWLPVGLHSPSGMWMFWDDHHIAEKTMIGYWDKQCPVSCSDPLIKATVYTGVDETIISVANWSGQNKEASLRINWQALEMNPDEVVVSIPEIVDFQARQTSIALDALIIPGGKGYLIVLK